MRAIKYFITGQAMLCSGDAKDKNPSLSHIISYSLIFYIVKGTPPSVTKLCEKFELD